MVASIKYIILSYFSGDKDIEPIILRTYPENLIKMDGELIKNVLPMGCTVDNFYEIQVKKYRLLLYLCPEFNETERGGIISFGFLLQHNIIIENFKKLFIDFIDFLKQYDMAEPNIISKHLSDIFDGLNSMKNISINGHDYNPNFFIDTQNIQIFKENRKIRGFL